LLKKPNKGEFSSSHQDKDKKVKIFITKTSDKPTNIPEVKYDSYDDEEYKVLFVGDTHYGENYATHRVNRKRRKGYNVLEKYGYDYPFQNIKSILLDSDLTVANLETPLVDIASTPKCTFSFSANNRFRTKKHGYWLHWSDVKIAPIYFKKYNLTNLSLANNHMLDYGTEGLRQTIESLHEHGIRYFGAGYNITQAAEPYVENIVVGNRTLKLVVISAFEYRKGYAEDFSWYASKTKGGVNPLSIKRVAKKIERTRKLTDENNTYVVAYPHWGGARNYGWRIDAQTRMGHDLIDAGADIVIGHGPHNLQQIEKYRGKWIIYSLGNFMYIARNRYDMWNSAPFSIVVKLIFKDHNYFSTGNGDDISRDQISKHMKIYPIITDNPLVHFQTRFVNQNEFEIICKLLLAENSVWKPSEKDIKLGIDKIGRFIEFSLC
jgi:poly-gamma-glutamate capsule biosynthesis protein CapA/YwtB (metallophosphatase superfamily)